MNVTATIAAAAARAVLGGYLAVHGAQKLWGSFGGHGLDATAAGFERMGLTPARPMATLAGGAELGGGVLTATGIAHPLGPVAVTGAMAVASAVHRKQGPFAAQGGFELPLTNLALATLLAATGPGPLRLGPRLSGRHTLAVVAGGAAFTGYALNKLLRPSAAAPASATADSSAARGHDDSPTSIEA